MIVVAAGLSVCAAYVHAALVDAHFDEWWAYGAFFLATAIWQGTFAMAIVRWPRPGLMLCGIATNVLILLMYVVSRTNGPPLGPHAGVPERVARIDVFCTLAELGVVVALISALPRDHARRVGSALGTVGLSLWTLRLTGVLL